MRLLREGRLMRKALRLLLQDPMPHGIQALVLLLGSHISDDRPGKEIGKFLHGRLDKLGLAPQLGGEEAVR